MKEKARTQVGSSFDWYKIFELTTQAPSEYAVDIRIVGFCNGLAISNVEDWQALFELLVVFNGQDSFGLDPSIVFEMLRGPGR